MSRFPIRCHAASGGYHPLCSKSPGLVRDTARPRQTRLHLWPLRPSRFPPGDRPEDQVPDRPSSSSPSARFRREARSAGFRLVSLFRNLHETRRHHEWEERAPQQVAPSCRLGARELDSVGRHPCHWTERPTTHRTARSRHRHVRVQNITVGPSCTKQTPISLQDIEPHGATSSTSPVKSRQRRTGSLSEWVASTSVLKEFQEGLFAGRCVLRILQPVNHLLLQFAVPSMISSVRCLVRRLERVPETTVMGYRHPPPQPSVAPPHSSRDTAV